MKKLFTLLFGVLACLSIIAAPKLQPKKLAKSQKADAVSIVYAAEGDKGVIDIIWQGDSAVSPAYDVQLGLLDTATYNYALIADLASYASSFAIDGYDGYFSISSDLVLYYGDNYSTIGEYGASDDVVAKWQAAWEASVNESDYTLKPGAYVIFVEGIDLSFNTTEEYDYAIVEIVEDVTTDAIIAPDSKVKAVKVINHKGDFMIINNGNCYDVLGRKIQ